MAQPSSNNILDYAGTAEGSRLLQQYDSGQYRQAAQQDREASAQERTAHDVAMEQLSQQRMEIAKMQTMAKIKQQELINQRTEQQAKDILGATEALKDIKTDSDSYNTDMLKVRAQYPAAFSPSKNGAEQSILDVVKNYDSQNMEHVKATNQIEEQRNEYQRQHGIIVPGERGNPDYAAAQATLDARSKTAAPAGFVPTEVTTDSDGKIIQKFAPVKTMPASVAGVLARFDKQIADNRASYDAKKSADDPTNAALIEEHNDLVKQRDALQGDFKDTSPALAPQTTNQANAALGNNAQKTADPNAYVKGLLGQ